MHCGRIFEWEEKTQRRKDIDNFHLLTNENKEI